MKKYKYQMTKGVTCKNNRDEWVPAIPVPFFYAIRKGCECGEKFWTMQGYEEHYAHKHILGL